MTENKKFFISYAIWMIITVIITVQSSPTSDAIIKNLRVTRTAPTTSKTATIINDTLESLLYNDWDDYIPHANDIHDRFSWELFRAIIKEDAQNNVIISPFSVKLLLAILLESAGNNTQTQRQLISTMETIKSTENLRGYYKKLLSSLKKESIYHTLNLETKLYVNSNLVEPKQRYTSLIASYYATDIERLNFNDAESSADRINHWCANVTNGRLKQLVTKENVEDSVLLLTNVLYFNGMWRREFTTLFKDTFYKNSNQDHQRNQYQQLQQSIQVEYMELTEYFYFYNNPIMDTKLLRLPYRGNRFSMFILYSMNKSIEELCDNLQNDQVKQMQFLMEWTKVKVTLPKFQFDFDKKLKDTLIRLGINEIFTDKASLPGLDRGANVAGKLKVTDAIQKAGIIVNEKGTEAYASTVFEIGNKFGGEPIIEEFKVNRPFIFFIEEEPTGSILFAGKVIEPHI